MKTYHTLFICLIFLVTNIIKAQDVVTPQALVTDNKGSIFTFDRSDKTIQGSPYVQEKFLPARVTADKEQIFNARYNAISDEVEVESEQNTVQAINKLLPGVTVTFLTDNKTYIGMSYFDEDGNSVNGYLVPMSSSASKVKLFVKESKRFIDRKPAKSSYQSAIPAKFVSVDDIFYFNIDNEMAKPLSSNKKEIASLFPKYEKDILKFIKSERLNVKKENDLKKLFTHINQLEK